MGQVFSFHVLWFSCVRCQSCIQICQNNIWIPPPLFFVKQYFVSLIKCCDQSLENKINKIFIVLKDAIDIYKALAV